MSVLSPYALTSLDEAKSYIGRPPLKDGLWLYCSASDATAATAAVSDTALTLIITGGTSAGTTTITFSSSSYNTITELVAGINAASGWAAGAIYHGDGDSTALVATGTLSCLGAANEITLKTEDNHGIEQLINRATDLVERYTGRKLLSRDYTNERYWGTGTKRLVLANYPALRVSAVKEGREKAFDIKNTTAVSSAHVEVTDTLIRLTADGTASEIVLASYATITLLIAAIEAVSGWDCTTPSAAIGAMDPDDILPNYGARYCLNDPVEVEIPDDYCQDYYLEGGVDETRGSAILYNPYGWLKGVEYHISYTAGYTTIPYALEMAVLELVKYKWDASQAGGIYRSESMGDYSYTLGDFSKGISDETRSSLDLFKRVAL